MEVSEIAKHIGEDIQSKSVPVGAYQETPGMIFNVEWNETQDTLLKKVKSQSMLLGELAVAHRGCDTAANRKYTGAEYRQEENSKRLLRGRDFWRYGYQWNNLYLYYLPEKMKKENSRARPGESDRFEVDEKLIVYRFLDKEKRLLCVYDDEHYYCLGSTYVVIKQPITDISLCYMLGILNSRLIAYYNYSHFEGVKITLTEMRRIPVRTIDFNNPSEKAQHDQIVLLVERMLDLHKQLAEAKIPQAKTMMQRQIEATDRQIDNLVYELYGLSEDEIKIVESS